MAVEIWNKDKGDVPVHVRLKDEADRIVLVVVDERGKNYSSGRLLEINKETAYVHLCSGVKGVPAFDIRSGVLHLELPE